MNKTNDFSLFLLLFNKLYRLYLKKLYPETLSWGSDVCVLDLNKRKRSVGREASFRGSSGISYQERGSLGAATTGIEIYYLLSEICDTKQGQDEASSNLL